MKRLLILLMILALLPAAALAMQPMPDDIGYTIVGDPWWKYSEGEIIQGPAGPQVMVRVENLVLPLPESGWIADTVPEELWHPSRRVFLMHPETGSYISVAYTDADPSINAGMIYTAMLEEGKLQEPSLSVNPAGLEIAFCRGLTGREISMTVVDGIGGAYIIELVYTKEAVRKDDTVLDMINSQYEETVYWMYID